MNTVLRYLTGLDYETPVSVLLERSGQLSDHQRSALFTLTSVHKALKSKQPAYIHSVLNLPQDFIHNPRHPSNCTRVEYKLAMSRCGYFYRGIRLYNEIPTSLANTEKQTALKKSAKKWILENIPPFPP